MTVLCEVTRLMY